ncbi:hypothetical protein Q4E93_28790 [Flavitalea sp. BT771]|uniref:hypothetical protein n=1 Tax=Flavitalea sp. BT771 TaxID=3063329 RepID=UPI0026E40BC0|nr:hypothetical protein [Flavitalea sp. BT771]MDO6434643.1 hypothetical protein [Flavitalea sp. BT771]MDV6223543.1 hypothetical protein [Flavitalea sp. BT771]
MKTIKRCKRYLPLFFALFMLPALNLHAADASAPNYEVPSREVIAHMTKEQKEARLEAIKARVDEIKAMDRSMLSKDERRALRKELRGMHKEAKVITGVYISIGALIIIILLLIIII